MRDRRWSFVTVALLLAISAASALLGTDDGWMRVPAGVIAALVLIVWMAYKWGVLEAGLGTTWASVVPLQQMTGPRIHWATTRATSCHQTRSAGSTLIAATPAPISARHDQRAQ